MRAKNPVEEEEEEEKEEEPARDGKGRMNTWSPAMDGDSEPVPIIPLCAMNRCKDFAKSQQRLEMLWRTSGTSLLVGVIHSSPYTCIHAVYVERKYIYIYIHTRTLFCTVAIFEDLKYSFLKEDVMG